jgi:hypothetical protein
MLLPAKLLPSFIPTPLLSFLALLPSSRALKLRTNCRYELATPDGKVLQPQLGTGVMASCTGNPDRATGSGNTYTFKPASQTNKLTSNTLYTFNLGGSCMVEDEVGFRLFTAHDTRCRTCHSRRQFTNGLCAQTLSKRLLQASFIRCPDVGSVEPSDPRTQFVPVPKGSLGPGQPLDAGDMLLRSVKASAKQAWLAPPIQAKHNKITNNSCHPSMQTGKLCRVVAVNGTEQRIKCDVADPALASTFTYNGSSFLYVGSPLTNPGSSKNFTLYIGGHGTPTRVGPAGIALTDPAAGILRACDNLRQLLIKFPPFSPWFGPPVLQTPPLSCAAALEAALVRATLCSPVRLERAR